MSQVRTNSLVPVGGIPAGANGGGIIQCVQTVKTDTFSTSLASGAESSDITGLTASLTPRSTSNKILISVNLSSSIDNNQSQVSIYRNSSLLTASVGDAAGSRSRCSFFGSLNIDTASFMFLDSPSSTSAQTYSLRIRNSSTITRTLFVNQYFGDTDAVRFSRSASTIILYEVSG